MSRDNKNDGLAQVGIARYVLTACINCDADMRSFQGRSIVNAISRETPVPTVPFARVAMRHFSFAWWRQVSVMLVCISAGRIAHGGMLKNLTSARQAGSSLAAK